MQREGAVSVSVELLQCVCMSVPGHLQCGPLVQPLWCSGLGHEEGRPACAWPLRFGLALALGFDLGLALESPPPGVPRLPRLAEARLRRWPRPATPSAKAAVSETGARSGGKSDGCE